MNNLRAFKIDKWTAIAIVIANMVGTGVFTSLGFQLINIQNGYSIALLWFIGGITALSGAFTYAEIGSFFTQNGGEYNYLSRLFHPAIGFVAGFVSIIIGFAAPISAASVAFSKYFSYTFLFSSSAQYDTIIALLVLMSISVIHLFSIKWRNYFQKYITLIKVFIMSSFLVAFFHPNVNPTHFQWHFHQITSDIFSSAFAVSLIYVSYAYSGWNAAAYVSAEIDNPQRNLSRALVIGTAVVMFFYVVLNVSFMYSTPIEYLVGKVEVGVISAQFIFGRMIGDVIGMLISILLISTISSMLIAAPGVLSGMADDYPLLSVFKKRNRFQSPYIALITIVGISVVLILTSSFEWLINFVGITLIIFTTLTSIGLFILRLQKDYCPVFKAPLYPFTSLFFILMNLWILIYVSLNQPSALLVSLSIMVVGFIIYFIFCRIK